MAGIGDDGLGDLDLAIVEIEQGAVRVDGGSADHRIVDLELADKIDRRLAHDAAIGAAHHAPGDDHLDIGVDAHAVGDVDVVGDDHQPGMVEQGSADRLGGGADVDEKRGIGGHEPGGGAAYGVLFAGGNAAARLVLHVFDARGEDRPAMAALEQALVADVVEILADRLHGHAEIARKVIDQHAPARLGQLNDRHLAGSNVHGGPTSALPIR